MKHPLVPVPLTQHHVYSLAPRVRQADAADLWVHGANPHKALTLARQVPGDAWAVMEGPVCIGAGGWTEAGAIWTLWADLSLSQYRKLSKVIVPWARIIAIRAKRPLGNVYLKGNRTTEHFLKSTGCIDIHHERALHFEGRDWVPFHLKALEDLPNV